MAKRNNAKPEQDTTDHSDPKTAEADAHQGDAKRIPLDIQAEILEKYKEIVKARTEMNAAAKRNKDARKAYDTRVGELMELVREAASGQQRLFEKDDQQEEDANDAEDTS